MTQMQENAERLPAKDVRSDNGDKSDNGGKSDNGDKSDKSDNGDKRKCYVIDAGETSFEDKLRKTFDSLKTRYPERVPRADNILCVDTTAKSSSSRVPSSISECALTGTFTERELAFASTLTEREFALARAARSAPTGRPIDDAEAKRLRSRIMYVPERAGAGAG
jgi:hypothetical protein